MFDPYRKWLGIPAWEQPPNHYRLLGINLFENDPDVIETAADRQMGHVRNYQAGKYSELSQRLLNELSAARICLLAADKKKAYDERLRNELAARFGDSIVPGPPFGFFVRGALRYFGVVARQMWLSRWVLPRAHVALGQDIVCGNRYRDRMPELYARLEDLTRRLTEIEAAQAPAPAETVELHATPPQGAPAAPPAMAETPEHLADNAQSDARQSAGHASATRRLTRRAANASKSTYYSNRRKALVRQIARTAWNLDYERAGPAALTTAVREALTGLAECLAEAKTLSEIPPGQWLSPKRLAWLATAAVGLLVFLFLLLRWLL